MIRVDPGHLRSGSCSPSRPGEACSPLEESEPESLSTQLSPSLLTLLSLRSTAFVTFVSETSKLPVKVKLKLCSFVTKSAKSNLRLSTILRREQIGQPMMIIAGFAAADSLDILQPATLSPLMISEMVEELGLLRSSFTKANITDEQIAFLTKTWYTSVLARIRINAFRVELAGESYQDLFALAAASVDAEAGVGNAVYMLPSFYNHDCDPNAHILWIQNAEARLKALRDVEEGEELRICYIDASMGHDARQTLLSKGFGFQCNCLRCLSRD
ncbi:histone-lysine N-methyltransferase ATXR4 isoform X4 [Quercus robur]|uniref:histone-lysine N-methyltransferase ATXR4 isoform X4 n=1 Tax=Quercus robur TaxID=38942 RepID=UPI002161A6C8|nr:histone-lysine N-methyltransferase ATXR4 isoform X4 [Quercus robur]